MTKLDHQRCSERVERQRLEREARFEIAQVQWRQVNDGEHARAWRIIDAHADQVPFFADLRRRKRPLSRAQVGAVLRIAQERGWPTALDVRRSRPPAMTPAEREAYERLREHQQSDGVQERDLRNCIYGRSDE